MYQVGNLTGFEKSITYLASKSHACGAWDVGEARRGEARQGIWATSAEINNPVCI